MISNAATPAAAGAAIEVPWQPIDKTTP